MSEVATYLKIGTTALVLDMIEDGFFDRDYSLQSPVQAIRDIAHDPTLRKAITAETTIATVAVTARADEFNRGVARHWGPAAAG